MRVLIIKTSSLGDVIHTLPAITDAVRAIPGISFDWVVEESFAEIPRWHTGVRKIIPVALRRWRNHKIKAIRRKEFVNFIKNLRAEKYDYVIDAQGLIKSALLTRLARGPRHGLHGESAREPLAAWAYKYKYKIEKEQHAITRVRKLFSETLGYALNSESMPDYGLETSVFENPAPGLPYVVFLHGTTWITKHWPENYWCDLARQLEQANVQIKIPAGNDLERKRALRIAATTSNAEVLPPQDLRGMASWLAHARVVIAVDTGLSHLAAAFSVPCISMYGPTAPGLTGAIGAGQIHLNSKRACAPCLRRRCMEPEIENDNDAEPPCFSDIAPARVWSSLQPLL
ncbi:MAG: lipopolysaccharide heptosyltransferase I [Acidiferrobacterales bacterium]